MFFSRVSRLSVVIIKSWAVGYFWRAMLMTLARSVKAEERVTGSVLDDSLG